MTAIRLFYFLQVEQFHRKGGFRVRVRGNELGIELMDCNSNGKPLPFILHKSKWNLVDQNYFKHESSESSNTSSEDKKLSVGSILILKEYTYENVDVIDKKANELDESEDYYLEDLIKIVDFFIIGFD